MGENPNLQQTPAVDVLEKVVGVGGEKLEAGGINQREVVTQGLASHVFPPCPEPSPVGGQTGPFIVVEPKGNGIGLVSIKRETDAAGSAAPAERAAQRRATASGGRQEVDFAVCEDGSLVELVEDPDQPGRARLLLWRDRQAICVDEVEDRGRLLVPISGRSEILRHVRLPRGVAPYGSVRELHDEVRDLLKRCVELRPRYYDVLAGFVFATWLVDRLPVAPYVLLVGLPQSGKTTLLQTLALVCRRPLLTADASSAALYEACTGFTPTLLIDETGTHSRNAHLRHLLRMGSARNVLAMRKGKVFHAYGAKVVCFLEPADDPALISRCLVIPTVEGNRADLAKPTDPEIERLGAELQNKLLHFRLERFKSVHAPVVQGCGQLRARERDLLACLMARDPEDSSYRDFLLEFFKFSNQAHREPLPEPQGAVLAALFTLIHHRSGGSPIQITEVTRRTNQLVQRAGHSLRLKPRKVGAVLTSLGFLHRERNHMGYTLWLTPQDQQRVHKLVKNHGLDHLISREENLLGVPPVKCQTCDEMGFGPYYTIGDPVE